LDSEPRVGPRARFRAYLEQGDRRLVMPALLGSGLAHVSSQIVVLLTQEQKSVADVPHSGWYAYLLAWPFFTVVCAWINAVLLRWTGRFLGGDGSVADLLTALGWSVMPVALGAPLVLAEALALIQGAADPEQVGGLPKAASIVVSLFFGATAILALFRLVISISEAQKFGKLRACGNLVLSLLPALALAVIAVALGARS
jgi:hypothetical protein